ncbi:MAG: flagellar hook-basal body complex protein FliE [Gemmatirosa sp.]|nr:flagellar hook-basal body complex protein FliE [Gemmatirosa sp.]
MADAISSITARMAQIGAYGPGVRPLDSGVGKQVPVGSPSTEGPSFGDTLKRFVGDVSAQQDAAADLQGRFVRGENVELHQVMAATEEASLSLDLMVELRNKVTEAYKTLVSMQS